MKHNHIKKLPQDTATRILNEWIRELKPIHPAIDVMYLHSYSLN
jgi:hypothetical protein